MSVESTMFKKTNRSADHIGLSRNGVSEMFDRIAWRYDLLNRVLSFGTDILWRKKVARFLPPRQNQCVLDLATGTADQIVALCTNSDRVKSAVGVDLAINMLKIGQAKIKRRGLARVASLMVGDARHIPTQDCQFDTVTISFGIRNVIDVNRALREMYRVLKPGGRILILEFSMPQDSFMRRVTLMYLRHILPRVGASVSGDSYAYRYLNETIETFPCGEAFCNLLRSASFTAVAAHPFRFGLPMIYCGERPM